MSQEQTAIVARGRSVHVKPPCEIITLANGNKTARPALGVIAGPGDSVSLPAEEIARLTALGFLVDPSAKPANVVRGDGPKIDTGSSVSIRGA